MQKGIDVKKPDVRNVRMSEVRNGEGKKEIMEKLGKREIWGLLFWPTFIFSLPPAYKTWEMLYF